ncbi:hypothetical protein ACH5BF_11165 [Arcobacter sp. YIC-464]|uniref:hypothetical protein n=1 Tax=Arcobacter sp. YIC-464 TaxID=3376631 RepID=UPI003C29ED8C
MNYTEAVLNHIDKLVGTLRPEDEIKDVLKRKFTKKEYKVFVAFEEGKSLEEVMQIVKEDEERVEKLYKSACKKVNQELFKKELVSFD